MNTIIYDKTIIMNNSGYLALYMGPMYSGKTSKLLELYKQYDFCNIKTLVINYEKDTRYSSDMLSTHDKKMIPCKKALKLSDIADILNETILSSTTNNNKDFIDCDVILINEGQFFEDIVEWVSIAIGPKYNKKIHICGLDGDFKREKFGNWLDLIPLSDKVEKLTSFCSNCRKNPAIFSYRLSNETEQTVIGSSNYVPLCRNCYQIKVIT